MTNKLFNLNESVITTVRNVLVNSQEQEINSLVEQATSLFFAHNKDASKTLPVFVKEYVMKKTMNPTLATICETVAKDNEKNLTETVESKGPQMLNEAAGSMPRNAKEKKLAAMAPPKDKITHKDVLVGRGVVAKEEMDHSSFGKKYKKNEQNNKHSENVVLLAKHFGSKADVDKANEILNKHMDLGHLSKDLHDARYKLHQKLMPKASKYMNEEVEQIDELKSSTLASYTVKASKSAMGTAAAGDSRTTKNRKFGIERAVNKLYKRAPDAPKDPWEDPKFYNAQFKNRQESTDTPGNSYKHQCAIHVKHEQFGEGRTIFSQHAEPDHNGNIAWYDVMFDHGIEKQVSINEMQVLQSESHMMHKKKKMKEEVDQIDEISSDLARDYMRKAKENAKKTFWNADPDERDSGETGRTLEKRQKGISVARKKLTGNARVNATEEVEQVDEMMSDPETLRADRSAETRTTPSGRKIVVKKPKKELKVEDVDLIDEGFKIGQKVNVTNPNATPRYKIVGKDDTNYHLEGPDGKNIKMPKERIHRVNKSSMNEELIDEAKRGRPRKNPLPAGQAPEEGDKEHFIMQLRKSVSMRGKKDVEFDNGEKMKVPAHVAAAVLDHYNSMKTAEQKDRLHRSVSKSPKHLMSHYEMYHGN